MGARFSCKLASYDKAKVAEVKFNKIRAVHLDGSLEEYQDPVTTDQVITNFTNHFLCTPIDILQSGLVPLKPHHQLKSGQIYFILPNSTLKFNAAPVDLTSLIRKLTNIAKTTRSSSSAKSITPSSHTQLYNPQGTSPGGQYIKRGCAQSIQESLLRSNTSPQWKPILATIIEG